MKKLNEFLYRNKLAARGDAAVWTPLAGGVSSEIWRVDLPGKTICVKRALAKLKVAADWFAPVERNSSEWEWFSFVHKNFPGIVPRPVAHDTGMGMLAMEFLPPEKFINWKSELLSGVADADFAAKAGLALGEIHARAAAAAAENLRNLFATDELFYALRIEPYLLATAEKHPDISAALRALADRTLGARITLVHGDVSPKNILRGNEGPVFLDAETAWFGDPAFDLAFCLNHFLLKAAHRESFARQYLDCFTAFSAGYLSRVTWEPAAGLNRRAAELLPALTLARIDGKSPVEYITDEAVKNKVRRAAKKIFRNPRGLSPIVEGWLDSIE